MAALADVLGNPGLLDTVALPDLINLQRQADYIRADILAAIERARGAASAPPSAPDRAVSLKEAALLLAMSSDYAYRHWGKLGGYRDADGHVKFTLSTIQQHIRSGRPRA